MIARVHATKPSGRVSFDVSTHSPISVWEQVARVAAVIADASWRVEPLPCKDCELADATVEGD